MEQTIEALNDIMVAKESEMLYKSKGANVPVPPSSVEEAREHLRQAEANLYRGEE